jgi:four helix bundle protein
MALAVQCYQQIDQLPLQERYGLASQMRRAAVSVPSNIAEGVARESDRDQRRLLVIARGSLAELATQLRLSEQLGILERDELVDELLESTSSQLNALIQRCGK